VPRSGTLEPDASTMRARVDACMERIVTHLDSLDDQPAGYCEDATSAAVALQEALPEQGEELEPLLDIVFEQALRHTYNTASPGYLAYIPGGGLFDASLADLIANTINRYTGVWIAAPLLVQLEANAIRWLCEVMDFPASAFGILTSGGSMSNFTAIVAARRERLPEHFLDGVLYTSDQAHYSVRKAAIMAGFPEQRVVTVESDHSGHIRLDRLQAYITRDRAAGLTPFFCLASAGTVNTGAVDDLPALSALCRQEGLWLHVDGAYGGFFYLTDRGRKRLNGIQGADSIALDPHKGLFFPYGTGVLLVRDGNTLRRAHEIRADYMPQMGPDPALDRPDFCNLSPELSRPFRGLRLWLVLRLHGFALFRRYLDEKLDLACHAARRIAEIPGIEIVAEPELSLFAFRLHRPGHTDQALDTLNHEFLDRILAEQRVWLSGTVVAGRFVLRICVLSFRTHREHVDEAIACIARAAQGLA